MSTRTLARLTLAASLLCGTLHAQDAAPTVTADGSIRAGSMTLPYSSAASPEARAFFPKMLAAGAKAPPITAPIEQSRAFYDRMNTDRAQRMMAIYPVKTHRETIAGVVTDVVEPAQGISPKNRERVLINLHGGAFLWGAHSGGLVESIPIASLGRIKVISVDYRQGPEHTFPAASEDVEAVYKALLKQYKPGAIGIYGCSAGGILTGEAVARLIDRKLRHRAPLAPSAAHWWTWRATPPTWHHCSTAHPCRTIRFTWVTCLTSKAPAPLIPWCSRGFRRPCWPSSLLPC